MRADRLKKALKFTEVDLDANREGKITHSQVERLRKVHHGVGKLGVGFIIAGIVMLVLINRLNANHDTTVVLVIFALSLLCLVPPMLLYSSINIQKDIDQAQVKSVKGIVTKRRSSIKGIKTYEILIGQLKFATSWYAYDSFADGLPYKIYYTPNAKGLLSAEMVDYDD